MIRKKEVIVCDVCEEVADGTWHSTEYLNGEVSKEYYCPLDLCETHMRIWSRHLSSEGRVERYEDNPSQEKEIKEIFMIEKLKTIEEDEDD